MHSLLDPTNPLLLLFFFLLGKPWDLNSTNTSHLKVSLLALLDLVAWSQFALLSCHACMIVHIFIFTEHSEDFASMSAATLTFKIPFLTSEPAVGEKQSHLKVPVVAVLERLILSYNLHQQMDTQLVSFPYI